MHGRKKPGRAAGIKDRNETCKNSIFLNIILYLKYCEGKRRTHQSTQYSHHHRMKPKYTFARNMAPTCRSMRFTTATAMILMTALQQPAANADERGTPLKVLLVGDSYASGNGAGNYESIRDCFRSSTSYGAQVARLLNATTFINRGCSGSVFADVINDRFLGSVPKDQNGDCPIPSSAASDEFYINNVESATCDRMVQAQVLALDDTVDFVLFAMGANDMQFEALVARCLVIPFRDARQCQNQIDFVRNNAEAWTQNLTDTLIAMHAFLQPTAKVIVLQFPHLLQEIPSYTYNPIFGGSVELTNQIRSLGILLDKSQRSAVAAANKAVLSRFVVYYDNAKALFAGHEANPRVFAENPDGWMHESWRRIVEEIYHLNQRGHAALADDLFGIIVRRSV